jgi:hypothetical protein
MLRSGADGLGNAPYPFASASGVRETGCQLAAFKGHDGAVTSLTFSPDGKTLASGSADRTALIWDLSTIKPPALPAKALAAGDLERCWQALATGRERDNLCAMTAAQAGGEI